MSHIKSVEVINFQSHKKTTLKFHEGVNAIVGKTDSGKSAIFRALAWDITNKPKGDKSFRSKWGGDTSVKINFEDGTSVERKKTKDNLYILNDNEDDAFTAFKDDIPDAIWEALNMDDINLQTQMDAPFLLSASSGDVAKMLNRIANLTTIDTSLSSIRKRTQDVTRDIANVKEQIEELEKEEKSFAYLKQMERDVEAFYALAERWQGTDDERSLLNHLVAEIDESLVVLSELDLMLSCESKVKEALTTHALLQSTEEQARKLQTLIAKICLLDDKLQSLPNLDQAENLLASATSLHEQKNEARNEWMKLNAMIRSVTTQQAKLEEVTEHIAALEEEFEEEFPDECPLCGAKI